MCRITDDERLSYLQDCLKDPTAQDIVADAIRNGDSFDAVEKRLKRKYDQPRTVFTEAVKGFMEMTSFAYIKASLSQLSKNFNRFRNILLRYRDEGVDQVFTAMVESRMGSRLLEEWKLYTNDKTAVPAGDELIEFCDQREFILSSSAEESNQDPRPQFYRPNFNSSPTSSNKRYKVLFCLT